MKLLVLSITLSAVVGRTSHQSTVRPAQMQPLSTSTVELKSNLSASDFKSELVGKWKSVFTYKNKQNVEILELTPNGNASLVVVEADKSQRYSGLYTVTFEREPSASAVTFATITIKATGSDPIALSRAHFGLHNGVHTDQGLLLRIDRGPRGVLKRNN